MTHNITLSYGKRPVRVIVDATGIWLAACDLFAATRRQTDRNALARMAPEHLKLLPFPEGDRSIRLTAVSPVGAVTIAASSTFPISRILDAWTRREVNKLAQQHNAAPLTMVLNADDTLPVKPDTMHDNFWPWNELKWEHSRVRQRPANLMEPRCSMRTPASPRTIRKAHPLPSAPPPFDGPSL